MVEKALFILIVYALISLLIFNHYRLKWMVTHLEEMLSVVKEDISTVKTTVTPVITSIEQHTAAPQVPAPQPTQQSTHTGE